ncbi:hypothetical protein OUZ56_006989 [Daphnia magna]|uniref:Uncharacterized protein n=1 Tax=Daphnia magna TaxID=35525 RepID=A0ABQ9YXA6_9CRUS|nr:hypothetical protein OUZ56_006989 [Daphnia magna]
MLEWLDNPNAYLRDFNQETEEREWLDDAFEHFNDVRHVNYAMARNQEELRSQMNEMEQHAAVDRSVMPVEEQKSEQDSQEEQKLEQNAMEQMNSEQSSVDGKYAEYVTYGYRYSRPTPPASIQVETKPEKIPVAENKADEIPVVLEQDQATERNPQPVFVEEQKAEPVPVAETEPVQVPVEQQKPNHSRPIDFEESGCFWSGTSPFCHGKCGTFYRAKIIDKTGDGRTCLTGNKKLCCPIPSNQLKSLIDLYKNL